MTWMTIGTDPEKISAMKDFPLPKSLKALRSFLGMVGWYRKFINNFASVAAPLTDLLKQKKKFVMTPEGKESFEALKDMLCSAPVLRSPDFWWSLKQQGFNFKIEHRNGRLNVVPDALSRVNEEELAAIDASHGLMDDLQSSAFKSGEYIELQEKISANSDKFPDLRIADGLLYRRTDHATGDLLHDTFAWQLWISCELVPEFLKEAHDDPLASHGGVHKTLERIRRYYFWPGLVTDVKEYR